MAEDCSTQPNEIKTLECNLRNQIRVNAPKIVWVPDAAFYYSTDAGVSQSERTMGLMSVVQANPGTTTIKQACDILLDVSGAEKIGRIYLGFRPMENDSGEFYYVDQAQWGKGDEFKNFYISSDASSIGFYLLANIPNYPFTKNIQMKQNILKFNLVNPVV